jgi:DNA-directed RNA polymerase subunit RPC12/RpoP
MNIIIRTRKKSKELLIQESLNVRMKLSTKEESQYLYNKKGYEGEVQFDILLEQLNIDCLVLNDLLFEINNKYFQIDKIIITQQGLIIFEVKNFEDEYYIEGGKWFALPKKEIDNPLDQLNRSHSLLHRLIQSIGYNCTVDKHLVFVNPEFTLYHTPMNSPIVLPTQLNRLVNKLNMMPSKLNENHTRLANKLLSLHIEESPFKRNFRYNYEELRKGFICATCHSFITDINTKRITCLKCGSEEDVKSAVLRSVEEIKLLFPEMKITTNIVFDWCRIVESKKTIRNVLNENYTIIGFGRSSTYK